MVKFAKAAHMRDDDDRSMGDEDARAPLAVTIGTLMGTAALVGIIGVVSIGTMDGMRSNAIENVRAQVMAGESSPVEGSVTDEVVTDPSAEDSSSVEGHLGTGGPSALDTQTGSGSSEGGASGSEGVPDIVESSVSVNGDGGSASASSSEEPSDTQSAYSDGYTVYDVQPGDTLSDISRKFGVSVDEIASANGIWDPNMIYSGSSLRIPTGK